MMKTVNEKLERNVSTKISLRHDKKNQRIATAKLFASQIILCLKNSKPYFKSIEETVALNRIQQPSTKLLTLQARDNSSLQNAPQLALPNENSQDDINQAHSQQTAEQMWNRLRRHRQKVEQKRVDGNIDAAYETIKKV